MRTALEPPLRALTWLVLGGWVGVLLFFPLVVAPAILRATADLGSPEAGARLVAEVLIPLEYAGVAAGAILAALAAVRRLGPALVLLPLLLGGTALAAHLFVTREMGRIRTAALGAAPDPALTERYFRMHRLSRRLYTAIGAGALVFAAGLVAREMRAPARRNVQ